MGPSGGPRVKPLARARPSWHGETMPDPRLLLDDALHPGARVALSAEQAHKLARVLRLGLGASLRAFNARDGEWRAVIEAQDKRGASVRIETQLRPPRPAPDLDLLFAPLKRDATDLVVEKATELGVRRIRPVLTQRTIAEHVRVERLALIARAAAEQSERFDTPAIASPQTLARALDQWERDRLLIHADEAGEIWGGARAPDIAAALAARGAAGKLAVLIGPEGGFSDAERRLLREPPFVVPVSLGPRILRAETAAIAALAVVQALIGDWRGRD